MLDPELDRLERLIAVLRRGDLGNPDNAYEQASRAGALARDLLDAAAVARACALREQQRLHGLSLGQVAARVGISKSRAWQLINATGAPVPPPRPRIAPVRNPFEPFGPLDSGDESS